MIHEQTDRTDRFDKRVMLASSYDELMRVDHALRSAERRLQAAHSQRVDNGPQRARELYLEVIALRHRSSLMLKVLAEIWVAES